MKRRVVVTGMGIMCPIGNTVDEVMQSVREGRCGIGPITQYDNSTMKVKVAGEVKDPHFEKYVAPRDMRRMDRCILFSMAAAAQAAGEAGITPADGSDEEKEKAWTERARWGAMIGSGIGGINTINVGVNTGEARGYDRVSPFMIPMCIVNMSPGLIAVKYGLHGICGGTVTACSSSANAIGDAFHRIADGYEDLIFAGGTEAALVPLCMGGFTSMHALTTATDPLRASIPFDKERSGFVMGEGAAVLILEEYEHAKRRGARILGEIAGYGATCDAYHMTAPEPNGRGAAASMTMAMKEAGITPDDVDYINAHGTSTKMNDAGETKAVKLALGSRAKTVKMSSTKSMTGHMLGASGAAEAVITLRAMQESFVPPTIGYKVPDEECDLDIVPNHGYDYDMRYALSNSFGFGGHDVSLVLKRAEE